MKNFKSDLFVTKDMISLLTEIDNFKFDDTDWSELIFSKKGFNVLVDLLNFLILENKNNLIKINKLEKYLLSDLEKESG